MEHSAGWLAVAVTAFLLVSGLDDLYLAAVYFAGRKEYERKFSKANPGLPEKWIAIWVPAWHEATVIERMVSGNASSILYANAVFFVGVYPNDEPTIEAVRSAAKRYPNVVASMVGHDGPTSKGDCLNAIHRRMAAWEREKGRRFDLVMVHDSEDVIHPDELAWVNELSSDFAMIQTPVLAIPPGRTHSHWIYRLYCDDFAYFHSVELPARWMRNGFIPSSGVGTTYRRDVIDRLAGESEEVFLPSALTEDYENGLRVAGLGLPQLFAPLRRGSNGDWIATREYFPARLSAACRQRTRWITGIALQGWERSGWPRRHLYWLWRDRKGLIANPLSVAATAALIVYPSWCQGIPSPILWALLAVAVTQCALRVSAVSRLYGLRMGFGAILRIPLMNLLNTICTLRAVWQFAAARRSGRAISWSKTDHVYPAPSTVGSNRRRIGQILVELGATTAVEVELAENNKPPGRKLGQVLLEQRKITEQDICTALGIQTGIESGQLEGAQLRKPLARILPASLVKERQVLPLQLDSGILALAAADLPDEDLMSILNQHVRLPVRFRLVPQGQIEEEIKKIS